jgi:8-oxo-dGTP pyrophosphatase MutT (NUDIX family)
VLFDDLLARVEAALQAPLPGVQAQQRMMPRPPRRWPAGTNPERIRSAAGLLLLFPLERRPHVVLTLRAGTLERHGGQVSLPGGAVDPGESFEQAALREAHEEVGLEPHAVQTLGALTPLDIHISGFRLHPIVAAATSRPALKPAQGEVARILEMPVDRLMDPASVVWRTMIRDDIDVQVPAFLAEGTEIWGATAMVLAEFFALLGWKGPSAE